jgi:hypothetical protein
MDEKDNGAGWTSVPVNCAGRINEMQRLAWTIHILLDGPKNIGYQELAISPARTDVARFIHLTVGPARSLREGTRLGASGAGGVK